MRNKEKRNDNMIGIKECLGTLMQWYVFCHYPDTLEVVLININKNNKITINISNDIL